MLGGGQAAAARPMRGRAGAVGAAGGARGAAGSSEPVSARSLPVPAPPAAARRALGGGAACTRLSARSNKFTFSPCRRTRQDMRSRFWCMRFADLTWEGLGDLGEAAFRPL